jgi:hypothetical protein
MKRYLILALIGLVLGFGTSYCSAWSDHYDNLVGLKAGSQNSWKDSLSVFGELIAIADFPGMMGVISQTNNRDFLIDEAWDYRYWEMLCNGLFWMIVFPLLAFLRCRILPRTHRTDPSTSSG